MPPSFMVRSMEVTVTVSELKSPMLSGESVARRVKVPVSAALQPARAPKARRRRADALHHQFPQAQRLRQWIERTPDGFLFLPKMHKSVTHGAHGKGKPAGVVPAAGADPVAAAQRFLDGLEPLREAGKLGPVLLQF